jgi:hypothetical protein
MEMGMRMMAASAPSTDPRSGSLGYALSQGLGGFMQGQDDVREQQRQERSDAVNEAYKMAIAGGSSAEAPKVETIYDENGREQKVVWNAATGQYESIGGSKVTKGSGSGSGVSINTKGLPKGYMWGQDPATGQPTAVPIPGLPQKGTGGGAGGTGGAAVVIEDIDRAMEMINNSSLPTTGLAGGVLSMVPGTSAYDIDALLTTVKANAGFDRLQQMRDQSPTGGALGQVSDKEIAGLQATIGNLSQSQSKEQLLQNLERVKRKYQEIIDGPGGGRGGPTQGGGTGPALPPGFVPVN